MVEDRLRLAREPGGPPEIRRAVSGAWIEASSVPTPDGGVLVIYRDITALKSREEELQEARTTHELVLDTMADGLILWTPDFRVRLVNRQLARFYAIPGELARPGVDGREILRVMFRRGDYGPPPGEGAALEAAVEAKAAAILDATAEGEMRLTPAGYWVEITRQGLADGSVLTSYRNITRLKMREDELKEARDGARAAEQALSATIEHMAQGLIMFSPDRRVRVMNGRAAELLELPPDLARPGVAMDDIVGFQRARGQFVGSPGSRAWPTRPPTPAARRRSMNGRAPMAW
jgi:PAS domain-containing protein